MDDPAVSFPWVCGHFAGWDQQNNRIGAGIIFTAVGRTVKTTILMDFAEEQLQKKDLWEKTHLAWTGKVSASMPRAAFCDIQNFHRR